MTSAVLEPAMYRVRHVAIVGHQAFETGLEYERSGSHGVKVLLRAQAHEANQKGEATVKGSMMAVWLPSIG